MKRPPHGDPAAGDPAADFVPRGGHWTPVADVDIDLIANSQTCGDLAIALCAWIILLREASYRHNLEFVLTADLLAKRMVVSPVTALKACRVLEGLGLLVSNTHRIPHSKMKTACQRTLRPAVLPWKDTRSTETVERSTETVERSTETVERSTETVERSTNARPSKLSRLLQSTNRCSSKKKHPSNANAAPALGRAAGVAGIVQQDAPAPLAATKAPEPAKAPAPAEPEPELVEGEEGVTSTGMRWKSIRQHDGKVCREFDWHGNGFRSR